MVICSLSLSFVVFVDKIEKFALVKSVFDRCKILGLFLSISCSLDLYDNKEF